MQGCKRAINTLSVRKPPQFQPIDGRRERENSGRQKGSEKLDSKKALAKLVLGNKKALA